ncbi:MAG: TIR domain-containing protein [Prevotella sp.]|nr:TIR domain-containing protein [Prevotella sp.]
MKDVYISYAPKDSSVVGEICEAMGKQDITFQLGGDVRHALADCHVVLFIISQHSIGSKRSNEELDYIFNRKGKGVVIPYKTDNAKMPMAWEFIFSSVNIRTMQEHPIDSILMLDICQSLSRRPKGINADDFNFVDIDTQGVDVMKKRKNTMTEGTLSLLSTVFIGGSLLLAISVAVLAGYYFRSLLLPLGIIAISLFPLVIDYVKKDFYEICVKSSFILISCAAAILLWLWIGPDGILWKILYGGAILGMGLLFIIIEDEFINRKFKLMLARIGALAVASGIMSGLWLAISPQSWFSKIVLGGISLVVLLVAYIFVDDNSETIERKKTTIAERIENIHKDEKIAERIENIQI